jgi:hypothetical protein
VASGAAYWDSRTAAETAITFGRPVRFLRGRWEERDWRNVPGPFYGAETDTCGTGFPAAPRNVLEDDEFGTEFLWRQPRDLDELRAVLDAAALDPFEGYNWDGDEHWTPDLVWMWWESRSQVEEWLAKADFTNSGSAARALSDAATEYRRYIADELHGDLERYADWLAGRL